MNEKDYKKLQKDFEKLDLAAALRIDEILDAYKKGFSDGYDEAIAILIKERGKRK